MISNAAVLPEKLARLEAVLLEHGFPVDDLQPGLPRPAIEKAVAGLGFSFPSELYPLYQWHNGSRQDSDLFLFRDQQLSTLESAMVNVGIVNAYWGVSRAFPFAELEGSFYVLPSEPFSFDPALERPVVSVFEGVDVYFCSLAHMVDTVIGWISAGAHRPNGTTDATAELAIWRKHNPGIFVFE